MEKKALLLVVLYIFVQKPSSSGLADRKNQPTPTSVLFVLPIVSEIKCSLTLLSLLIETVSFFRSHLS